MNNKDYVKTRREDVKPIPQKWAPLIRRVMRGVSKINVWVFRKSGGRLMKTFAGSGAPICIVTVTGRKTGQPREIALIHIPWQEKKLLVASLGGMETHPIWYHNIVANPEIRIYVDGEEKTYLAEQASEDQKRHLWPHLLSVYPDFDEYQARTDRDIPVFVCSPTNTTTP